MKRRIVEARRVSRLLDELTSERKLLKEDFEALKRELINNPQLGDLIPGTGGVRKVRLKSSTKGKRGGFRVCYFDDPGKEELFLLTIYSKGEREDLSADEKKSLKEFTQLIKGG
jgi:hypothetical protein